MTRLSSHLLVQRVADRLVIVDESTGNEVEVPLNLVGPFVKSIVVLFPDGPKHAVPPREPSRRSE